MFLFWYIKLDFNGYNMLPAKWDENRDVYESSMHGILPAFQYKWTKNWMYLNKLICSLISVPKIITKYNWTSQKNYLYHICSSYYIFVPQNIKVYLKVYVGGSKYKDMLHFPKVIQSETYTKKHYKLLVEHFVINIGRYTSVYLMAQF